MIDMKLKAFPIRLTTSQLKTNQNSLAVICKNVYIFIFKYMLDDEKKKRKHTDNYTHMNTSYRQNEKNREIEQIQYTHIYDRRKKKNV